MPSTKGAGFFLLRRRLLIFEATRARRPSGRVYMYARRENQKQRTQKEKRQSSLQRRRKIFAEQGGFCSAFFCAKTVKRDYTYKYVSEPFSKQLSLPTEAQDFFLLRRRLLIFEATRARRPSGRVCTYARRENQKQRTQKEKRQASPFSFGSPH